MSDFAVVENGVVVNMVVSEEALSDNWIAAPEGVGIGDSYQDGEFAKRQLEQIGTIVVKPLSVEGAIKHNEAMTWLTFAKNTPIKVAVQCDVPDRSFVLGLRKPNNDVDNVLVTVVDGVGTIEHTFPIAKSYQITDAELNRDLPEPVFHIETPIKIDVV